MTTELPTTTSEITAQWLTAALRESGTIGDDVSVAAVETRDTGSGIGFMGEVGTVDVVYEGEAGGAPTTVVAKFPTASPEVRAMMHPTRVYEREHTFYRELADQTPLRTPNHFHITCVVSDDPHAEQYMMLMEDLSHLTIGDQLNGVTVDQARAALVGLAAHHARFWNASGLDDAAFIPIIDGPLNQAGQQIYAASYPGFVEVFGDVLTPEIAAFGERYGDIRPAILDRLAAMPHTLVHFDYRADNLFFDDDGSVAVIDWQAISVGGGAADVGYFLSQNLSIGDRRAHEDELLHAYHEALVADGVTDYPFDQLVADYDIGILCGWIIPAFAVGSLDVSSDRAMALWNEVVDRVQTAILDRGLHEWQA
jgi:aminoglycoside/choline kinase family phosphotransferase